MYFTYSNVHVSMLFSSYIPPFPSSHSPLPPPGPDVSSLCLCLHWLWLLKEAIIWRVESLPQWSAPGRQRLGDSEDHSEGGPCLVLGSSPSEFLQIRWKQQPTRWAGRWSFCSSMCFTDCGNFKLYSIRSFFFASWCDFFLAKCIHCQELTCFKDCCIRASQDILVIVWGMKGRELLISGDCVPMAKNNVNPGIITLSRLLSHYNIQLFWCCEANVSGSEILLCLTLGKWGGIFMEWCPFVKVATHVSRLAFACPNDVLLHWCLHWCSLY